MKFLLGVLVVLASATLDTRRSSALSCIYTPFEQQVEWAKLIFVGTAVNDTSVWVPCPGGTDTCTIVTKYRFDQVTYLRGQGPADSLVLVQMGGTVGNDMIMVSGEVEFELGSRYVVLARRSERVFDSYSASPCGLGPFGIWPDSSSAGAVVHLGRNPLVAFDGTHLVGLHSQQWTPDLGVWETDASRTRRPPSRRSLSELIQATDADLRSKMESEGKPQEHIEQALARVRTISLFPHQDPGDRVSEEEFLNSLASVIKRVEEAPAKK